MSDEEQNTLFIIDTKSRMTFYTVSELESMNDVDELTEYLNNIEARIIVIETDLDWREDNEAWFNKALSALKAYKIAKHFTQKRIKQLNKKDD